MLSWISNIFSPAVKLIDDLHTSDEEKLKLRNEFAKIQAQVHSKTVELAKAESESKFFLTATWRPICSLAIVIIIVAHSFGWISPGPQIYDLAEIFLGAYAGGRSLEKLASRWSK
jgi:hypothetical protein